MDIGLEGAVEIVRSSQTAAPWFIAILSNRGLKPSYSLRGDESFRRHAQQRNLPPVRTEAEKAATSRYVLLQDLDTAIKHLDDQQLDRLVTAALEERTRCKKQLLPQQGQRKQHAEAVAASLPQGKSNAVRAAFKAGVTPARIAREFGISRSDVQRALTGEAGKQ